MNLQERIAELLILRNSALLGSLHADYEFFAAAWNDVPDLIAGYEAALHALEASHRDRETLKQRHDGVYGALADAATVVVSTDNPGESVRALLAERDKLAAELAQQAADWAETDTAIRKLCGHVDDGYMVPIVDVVRRALGK